MVKKTIILGLILAIGSTHAMHFNRLITSSAIKSIYKSLSNAKVHPILSKTTALLTFVSGVWAYNSYTCHAEESTDSQFPEFEKFAHKFAPPEDVKKTIEDNKLAIAQRPFGWVQGSPAEGKPDIYVKKDEINRVINAERMRECIRRNNLTRVAVPRKYIYKVYDEWMVIAQNIKANLNVGQLSFEQTKELMIIAEQTGYRDWTLENLLVDQHGMIYFIDLDDDSFIGKNLHKAEALGYRPIYNKVEYVKHVCANQLLKLWMGEKNQQWCQERKNYWQNCSEGTVDHNPLPRSTEFDTPDIDFEKVKQEFAEMQRIYWNQYD